MTRRRFMHAAAELVATAIVAVSPGEAGACDGPDRALRRFRQSIADYLARVRALERHLPRLQISRDAWEIHRAVEARAAAIQRMRRRARRGDIFTPEVSGVFRDRIRHAISTWGYSADDVEPEEDGIEPAAPMVNGRFQWAAATPTPAAVLAALPGLPDVLQYRFVRADLVLIDADAGVILDVLPNAVDGPATPASAARCRAAQPHRAAVRS